MICREFIELVGAYFDGELDSSAQDELDAHLAECLECSLYLDSYRKTVELSKMAMRDDRSEEPPEDLVQAILNAKRSRRQ